MAHVRALLGGSVLHNFHPWSQDRFRSYCVDLPILPEESQQVSKMTEPLQSLLGVAVFYGHLVTKVRAEANIQRGTGLSTCNR